MAPLCSTLKSLYEFSAIFATVNSSECHGWRACGGIRSGDRSLKSLTDRSLALKVGAAKAPAPQPPLRTPFAPERQMIEHLLSTGLLSADMAWIALGLAVAGMITGLFAGLFGVGGGAIIVPVLYELFGLLDVPLAVRMPLAVGTSLAIIVPTSIRSFQSHLKRGAVDLDVLRAWAATIVIGVMVGALVARFSSQAVFKLVFIGVTGFAAFRLLVGKDSWRLADDLPSTWPMRAIGFMIGLLSTLMGIGGGVISNIVMAFYGRPIHQSVATSSGVGVLISIPGMLGYIYAGWPRAAEFPNVTALQWPLALGYVSLLGFILVVPTSMIAAPLGARLAHALQKRHLEILFGVFQLAVCVRFIVSFIR